MPSLSHPRKPYERDPADAVARLYEVAARPTAPPLVGRTLERYKTRMAGGGMPVAVEFWTSQHVAGAEALGNLDVVRTVPGGRSFRIAGYAGMMLFVGDELTTAPGVVAALELLQGGRVGIQESTTARILNEGEVAAVLPFGRMAGKKAKGVWDKFNKQERPLTIQTRGGVMGTRD